MGDGDDQQSERHVVTVFLRHAGELLLCRRSEADDTEARLWDGVTHDADGDPGSVVRSVVDRPDAVTLVRRGDPLRAGDEAVGGVAVVHPFLFDCDHRGVKPTGRGRECVWVSATELLRRETVPWLWDAYDRVRPTVDSVATDGEHGSAWLSIRALEVLRDEAGVRAVDDGDRDGNDGERAWESLVSVAGALLDARPSMAALTTRVNRAMSDADGTADGVERAAREGIERAVDADDVAAATAAERVAGETVLTLSRSGTVERALGKAPGPAHVYVAESRPAREGVGVAERLARQGRDVTLVTDAAVAHVLATEGVDRVVVGADTLVPDGSVVNKTGTRGAALAAVAEGVPVDVVAAVDKVATRGRVVGESGPAADIYDGPAPVTVSNPTFDRTPPAAVTGVVTDRGVLDTDDVEGVAAEFRALGEWRENVR